MNYNCRMYALLYIGSFWGAIADDIKAVECPTGFQGINNSFRTLIDRMGLLSYRIDSLLLLFRVYWMALPACSCYSDVLQCSGNFDSFLSPLLLIILRIGSRHYALRVFVVHLWLRSCFHFVPLIRGSTCSLELLFLLRYLP